MNGPVGLLANAVSVMLSEIDPKEADSSIHARKIGEMTFSATEDQAPTAFKSMAEKTKDHMKSTRGIDVTLKNLRPYNEDAPEDGQPTPLAEPGQAG